MRPVYRGNPPFSFRQYSRARKPLVERLGTYCSYCERRINNQLALEHICSKKEFPDLRLEWSNFLLTCSSCNSIKRWQMNISGRTDYYWPDVDNTAKAFVYQQGMISVHPELTQEQQNKARQTLLLTGLDRHPNHPSWSKQDMRWWERHQVWDRAEELRRSLALNDSVEIRQRIVESARWDGCWSVWMTVFTDDVDMRRRLIEAFPGTCQDCFDEETQPLPRPGSSL